MSEKIDYSKGIYDARQLGAGRMFILGVQHMFAMFGAHAGRCRRQPDRCQHQDAALRLRRRRIFRSGVSGGQPADLHLRHPPHHAVLPAGGHWPHHHLHRPDPGPLCYQKLPVQLDPGLCGTGHRGRVQHLGQGHGQDPAHPHRCAGVLCSGTGDRCSGLPAHF